MTVGEHKIQTTLNDPADLGDQVHDVSAAQAEIIADPLQQVPVGINARTGELIYHFRPRSIECARDRLPDIFHVSRLQHCAAAPEDGRREGVLIAREMLEEVKADVVGAYLMPQFGRFRSAVEVLEAVGYHFAAEDTDPLAPGRRSK